MSRLKVIQSNAALENAIPDRREVVAPAWSSDFFAHIQNNFSISFFNLPGYVEQTRGGGEGSILRKDQKKRIAADEEQACDISALTSQLFQLDAVSFFRCRYLICLAVMQREERCRGEQGEASWAPGMRVNKLQSPSRSLRLDPG